MAPNLAGMAGTTERLRARCLLPLPTPQAMLTAEVTRPATLAECLAAVPVLKKKDAGEIVGAAWTAEDLFLEFETHGREPA